MGGRGSRPPNFFTASAKIAEIRAPTVREGYTRRLPQPFPNGRGSVQLFHALWRRPRRHGWLLKVPPIKGGVGGCPSGFPCHVRHRTSPCTPFEGEIVFIFGGTARRHGRLPCSYLYQF